MHGIQIEQTGGPEVMRWVELPDPVAAPGHVVVRLAAGGLNYIDTYFRSGLYPNPLPFTPGMEGAGDVVAVGEGVSRWSPGDRVAWSGTLGTYAELVAVPAEACVAVPPGVDSALACASLLQGMTAHYLVNDTFALGRGHRCLIHAGAGGVGLLLVQMAKAKGAEVFTTVGSPDKVGLVEAAGADHVILYRDTDFVDAIESIAGPKAIDVIYDGVGRLTLDRGLDALRPRGLMATFGNASGAPDPVAPLRLMQAGSVFLTRPNLTHYTLTREELERRAGDVFAAVASGDLDVRIGGRLPLSQAAEAHRMLEGRTTTGKILLEP